MIREFIDLYRYHKKHGVEEATQQLEYFYRFKSRALGILNRDMKGLNILDVGCGKTYPFSYMFHLEGSRVTALDTQHLAGGVKKYFYMLYFDGLKVSSKTLFRDMFFTPTQRKVLKQGCNIASAVSDIKFVCSSAERMPFDDNSFDIVFSFNAFEHIQDLNKAVSECVRVIKPDGLMYATFHLFTSISGGHHPKWFYPDSDPPVGIPPWYHLRGQRDKHVPGLDYDLNCYALKDYQGVFKKHSVVLNEYSDREEGKQFLTGDVRKELAKYSDEELLTVYKTIMARK